MSDIAVRITDRENTKSWIRVILAYKGIKPTELARSVGVVPSTLNRFLNDHTVTHDLSRKTIDRIASFAKVKPFELPQTRRHQLFSEAEAEVYTDGSESGTPLGLAVKELCYEDQDINAWILRSRAIEYAGYLPGDILIVNLLARAKSRDVVCAQVYDWTKGQKEIIFRIYEPPYLISQSSDEKLLKPLIVDDDCVVIKGVVVYSLRQCKKFK